LEILKKIKENKKIILSVPNFRDIAHVRRFKDEKEIISRYGELIEIYNIKIHKTSETSKIFVLNGIKK